MVNYNDEWNVQLCQTVHLSAENTHTAKVKCDCSVSGFIGVGLFIDNTYIPNSVKEIYQYDQPVTFRLVINCDHLYDRPKTVYRFRIVKINMLLIFV